MRKRALQIKVVDPENGSKEYDPIVLFKMKFAIVAGGLNELAKNGVLLVGAYVVADTIRSVIIAKASK